MNKNKIVARLTAIWSDNTRSIIEVHSDATFSVFYRYFTQVGLRRSTKKQIRVANRNEGLYPHYRAYRMTPGLEVIGNRLSAASAQVKIRIIRKREYRRLLTTAADVLGMVHAPLDHDRFNSQPIRVAWPTFEMVNKINRSKLTHGIR